MGPGERSCGLRSLRTKSPGAAEDREGKTLSQASQEENWFPPSGQEKKRGDAGGPSGYEEEGGGIETSSLRGKTSSLGKNIFLLGKNIFLIGEKYLGGKTLLYLSWGNASIKRYKNEY